MKTVPAGIKTEKNLLASVNPWVWLLELGGGTAETSYFTNDNDPVIYSGNTYRSYPFAVGVYSEEANGNLSGLAVTISNSALELSTLIDRYRGLVDRPILLRYGNRDTVTGTFTQAFTMTFRVRSSNKNKEALSFLLGNDNLIDYEFPKNRFDRNRCSWAYARDGGGLCAHRGTWTTPVYVGGGAATMTGVSLGTNAKTEAWTITFVSAGPHWTVSGSLSGAKANAPATGAYNNGIILFTISGAANNGDIFTLATENLATCDRTLRGSNGCEKHQNVARFGGAPGIVPQ
jgi:phage-related protein